MGLSASQVRLLSLTSRKHDIEGEEMILSNRRSSLAMDMDRVTLKYQNALNSKVLKMSMNSGISTVDLSYANLMTPNITNNYKPYVLVNSSGKVVVNDKYKKYAEMISSNGNPVSDWSEQHNKIISELTGIPESDLENSSSLKAASDTEVKEYQELRETRDIFKSKEPKADEANINKILKLLDNSLTKDGIIIVSSGSDIKKLTDSIYKSLNKYFIDDSQTSMVGDTNTKEKLQDACNAFATTFSDIGGNSENAKKLREQNTTIFKTAGNKVALNVQAMLEQILGGLSGKNDSTTGKKKYTLRDTSSAEWQNWYKELQNLDNQCVEKYNNVKSAINNENQIFSAAQESEIKFYEQLFTAIAENGWILDDATGDNDYLNQMMQNNEYQLMTMTENKDYQDDKYALDYGKSYTKNKYDYNTDIALNCTNIVAVNDKNAINQAQVEYEHEKMIINQKETRIDERMKNLDTELSAINEMLKGIKQVAQDNIERHMNITG